VVEKLTFAHFIDRVGESFRIVLDETHTVDTVLSKVVDLTTRPSYVERAGFRAPFSLTFRGPGEFVLPQRIYHLEHEEMGALTIFLVPIGPDGEGMQYEAIFA